MTYEETVDWMFDQLPMYQLQGASAYKKDLTNTILLVNYLENPEKKLKCIHVAGTNGKGSTSHMIASILQEAGYKTGLYTSPHLQDFRERIKINGVEIPKDFVAEFITKHQSFFESNQLSFFEMSVGLAFEYFRYENIDIAVIETGMGGRLDSTNIIMPLVSVITNIGMDHTQFLGNTLELIAFEKAGIIKPHVPVVIGEYTSETKKVFLEKAKETQSEIFFASDLIQTNYASPLAGNYQRHNKKTVLQTIKLLIARKEIKASAQQIRDGFLNVIKNTGLYGRWQQLGLHPKIICDTAHNVQGLEVVMRQLQDEKFDSLHMVIGMVNDKDLRAILPAFPKNACYYFCKPNIYRGMDQKELQNKAQEYNLMGDCYHSVAEAYAAARQKALTTDLIYVGGSTFVVGEIL